MRDFITWFSEGPWWANELTMTSQSNTHHLMDFTLSRRQKHQFTNGTILIASLGHILRNLHFMKCILKNFKSICLCQLVLVCFKRFDFYLNVFSIVKEQFLAQSSSILWIFICSKWKHYPNLSKSQIYSV